MQRIKSFSYIIVICVFAALGCGGSESMPGVNDGNGVTGGPVKVKIMTPTDCQRVPGDLSVFVEVSDPNAVDLLYITINGVIRAILNNAPFSVTVPKADLPVDGTIVLEALAKLKNGKNVSNQIDIRIDNDAPFYNNFVIVDAAADPLGIGGDTGAIFKLNPETGKLCLLAQSVKFRNPVAMHHLYTNAILVTDYTADTDGTGPGIGTVFEVYLDKYSEVNIFKSSGLFRGPIGIDIDPATSTVYIADYNADPYNLSSSANGPGAVFAINHITKNITTVVSSSQFVSPVGVTYDASGDLWIVDSDANVLDPPANQNHGSVWRYHQDTTNLELVTATTESTTPYKVLPDGAGGLILVDTGNVSSLSDGKLWKIDLTAPIDPLASASILKYALPMINPAGMYYDAGYGLYFIADRNSEGSGYGQILTYNPATDTLLFNYSSIDLVEPFDILPSSY